LFDILKKVLAGKSITKQYARVSLFSNNAGRAISDVLSAKVSKANIFATI